MAITEARTKDSKSLSISATRRLFSMATAACAAMARITATSAWEKGTTQRSASALEVILACLCRFRLMSWRTPTISPVRVAMGTVKSERV